MAVDLKSLSPKELRALISNAESQMQEARANQVKTVREKIDAILKNNDLSLADVYPARGVGKTAKKTGGKRGSVAPKYRNPENPSEVWTGRGRQPLWFLAAIKRRGVTADSLLIAGASKSATKAAKKTSKKTAKKPARKKIRR